MARLLAIALLGVGLVLPLPLGAQFRPAPHPVTSSPVRMGPGLSTFRLTPGAVRTGTIRPAPSGGRPIRFGVAPHKHQQFPGFFAGTPCLTNPSYSDSFFCRQFIPRPRPVFGQALIAPYFWFPPSDYQPVEGTPATVPQQDEGLSNQLQKLTEEIELLREDRGSHLQALSPPASPPQAVREEKPLPAVLVYRDGRQGEVENYAVLGQTLWVFADRATRKIALADLDLQATMRINGERGIDFIAPTSR